MKILSRILGLVCVALSASLAGCAAPELKPPQVQALLHDDRFQPPSAPISTPEQVFAISPAMQAFLHDSREFGMLARKVGEREALLEALYSRKFLQLEYEASMTRNASEAFEARSGNCLSLVIMTAVFARELGLPVRFQSVLLDDSWSRSGDLYFVSGHVNLTLGATTMARTMRSFTMQPDLMTIDFVTAEQLAGQRSIVIDESTITAMYMNNRAAEMLNIGKLDDAYWWARAALLVEPRYFASYNTLAVIYRRHGDTQASEVALRQVLEREPANLQAMSNLVLVLRDQSRNAEADRTLAKVREMQPYPPFYFFDRGVAAMKEGDYVSARADFQREVDRAAYYHEFHFWLALANYALGDYSGARAQVALALENSTTTKDHNVYAAKLSWLESHKPVKPGLTTQRW